MGEFTQNHFGTGQQFKKDIVNYLEKEVQFSSAIQPLDQPPFDPPIGISPLKDGVERQVILDLSFLVWGIH